MAHFVLYVCNPLYRFTRCNHLMLFITVHLYKCVYILYHDSLNKSCLLFPYPDSFNRSVCYHFLRFTFLMRLLSSSLVIKIILNYFLNKAFIADMIPFVAIAPIIKPIKPPGIFISVPPTVLILNLNSL